MSKKDRFFFELGGLGPGLYDFANKEANVANYVTYMLARTQSMFEYEGLPETVPQRMLENLLQCNGFAVFTEVKGSLYAFRGGLGGPPDPYYRPTICTVSNPALSFNKELKIGEDCVLVPSDSYLVGLLPLFRRYASQLAENDLTIFISTVNSRITALLSAPNDNTRKAAEKYLEDVLKGKLGVIAEAPFLDGVKAQPYGGAASSNQTTQLIELQQYLKAGWYNDLGLQSNYNMKREAINSNEAQLNEQSLLPLVDDMLRCRRTALEQVNEKYGTKITVNLFSSWDVQHNDMNVEETDQDPDISGRTEKEEGDE